VGVLAAGAGVASRPSRSADVAAGPAPVPAADPPSTCAVTYQLRDDDGHVFHSTVAVANTTARPVTGWRVSFTFPADQRIVAATGGRWVQQGRAVRLTPVPGREELAGHARTVLRLTGSYRTVNPLPVAFHLGDRPCTPTVLGPDGVPSDGPIVGGLPTVLVAANGYPRQPGPGAPADRRQPAAGERNRGSSQPHASGHSAKRAKPTKAHKPKPPKHPHKAKPPKEPKKPKDKKK
jgi:eukaryotic-like serine/threonine-protein kinase